MTTTATKATATTLALLVAATVLMMFAGTASADRGDYRGGNDGDSIKVENSSSATVYNNIEVEAETGENTSTGGDAGNGGRGGNARGDNATGGNGGHGANGGNGGYIETGDASAYGTLLNDVNYNLTEIEACDCDEDHGWMPHFMKRFMNNKDGGSSIRVENNSTADVNNEFEVEAETGENTSEGGYGGDGGRGGNATAMQERQERTKNVFSLWMKKMWGGNDDDWTTGGNGGHGGNGAAGGSVVTGDAYAEGHVTNYVNHNITRITRADEEGED